MKSTIIAMLSAAAVAKHGGFSGFKAPLGERPSHVTEPLAMLSADDLPTDYDWGNVNGVNFLT